jgi:hypothetical protein
MAATAHLTVVVPDNEKFTVQPAPARLPRRKPNAEYRSREHLTEREVERLIEAMKGAMNRSLPAGRAVAHLCPAASALPGPRLDH